MSDKPFLVPSSPVTYEQEVKKSRFIVDLAHTPTVEAAKAFISDIKKHWPDARHHCSAFVAGAPQDSMKYGFSDDGEPSGTAGKPILAQLTGSGVGEITAVVTRYFGGIKLGTGGLVKAYGGTVQQALGRLPTQMKVQTVKIIYQVPFALQNLLEISVGQFAACIDKRHYENHLIAEILCPSPVASELHTYLLDISKGQISRLTDCHK